MRLLDVQMRSMRLRLMRRLDVLSWQEGILTTAGQTFRDVSELYPDVIALHSVRMIRQLFGVSFTRQRDPDLGIVWGTPELWDLLLSVIRSQIMLTEFHELLHQVNPKNEFTGEKETEDATMWAVGYVVDSLTMRRAGQERAEFVKG